MIESMYYTEKCGGTTLYFYVNTCLSAPLSDPVLVNLRLCCQ